MKNLKGDNLEKLRHRAKYLKKISSLFKDPWFDFSLLDGSLFNFTNDIWHILSLKLLKKLVIDKKVELYDGTLSLNELSALEDEEISSKSQHIFEVYQKLHFGSDLMERIPGQIMKLKNAESENGESVTIQFPSISRNKIEVSLSRSDGRAGDVICQVFQYSDKLKYTQAAKSIQESTSFSMPLLFTLSKIFFPKQENYSKLENMRIGRSCCYKEELRNSGIIY